MKVLLSLVDTRKAVDTDRVSISCGNMDENVKHERETNPRENANFLSKITFFFAFPTLRKGLKKKLDENDIYKPMKNCYATRLGDRLEEEMEKHKNNLSWAFMKALVKIFGWRYLMLGIALFLINTPLTMAKPLLNGKIVSYFTPHQKDVTKLDAYCYAALLVACTYVNTVFLHAYIFEIEQLTLRIKIAISALLYRKSLKLSTAFMSKATSGQAITLISKDINNFDFVFFHIHKLGVGIFQICIMTYMMYVQIGVSALVGASALFAFIPFQAYLAKLISLYRRKTAEKTDQRVRVTQEMMTAIRIIKMYTWELFFSKTINMLRKKEIQNLRVLFYLRAVALSIGQLNSKFALYICIMVYVGLGNYITAEKAFVVTGCFTALRVLLTIFIPLGITQISELKTAIQRVVGFLHLEEVDRSPNCEVIGEKQEPLILIENVTVTTNDGDIVKDVKLQIKSGLTLVTGSVGSGKSTLLKVILGDLKKTGVVEVSGRVSYASQEPWLFPGTVRQNILFGEHFDQERYNTIVKVCALKKDFEDLPDGDRTCLIDRGLNLSRGQKTRVNLARAIYKKADIYLLDDCLSAVDPHVGKHIFFECIKEFLKDKICILVTHQEKFLKEANDIVILNKGYVIFQGDYDMLRDWNREDFKAFINNNEPEIETTNSEVVQTEKVPNDAENANESTKLLNDLCAPTKNIYHEVTEEGSIKKKVYWTYFKSGGGIKMILFVMILSIAAQAISSWSDYFVSFWVDMEQELSEYRQNQTTNSTEYKELEEEHSNVMRQYSFVIFGAAVLIFLRSFAFYIFSTKASIVIHRSILNKIVNATMKFFDKNLSGNVINRFSRDLGILDEVVPHTVFEISRVLLMLGGILYIVTSVNTIFLIPSGVFLVILYFARRLYIPTGRSIRRLEGATRSPVIGQFNATLEGLTTIRASKAQSILKKEFDKHLDLYNSAVFMHISMTRAFGFYLDSMCDVFVALITMSFLVFKTDTLAGRVGLALTQAFSVTGILQWAVRQWAELENQMTSVERVLEYTNIEEEEKSGDSVSNWPNKGKVVYSDVNLCYCTSNERVLKDIKFTIEPKQKIGVVGRTGAGKSSIIATLFRLYEFQGTVTIDGVNINSIAVELLRSKISIIPQDPVLFSGTIRSNLDPKGKFSDMQLWDALEEVEMKGLIDSLDCAVNEEGANFSVGQRQLICLARSIIWNNMILVLDEATANIDPLTDSLIQKTIKRRFSDCTVITIAHRLNTIMESDKVLVMDSGCVVEYEHPNVLLNNHNSLFYKMVSEAGLM